MSKYNTIFDGKFLTDVAMGETGYNYYSYLDVNSNWVILRENTDENEYRVVTGHGNYSSIWTLRADQSYKKMEDISIKQV